MIDKDKFKEAIYNSKKYIEHSYSEALKFIDMDKLDEELLTFKCKECDILWEALFTEEGVDWINWWLYEKGVLHYNELIAKDANGNIIPTETIDDLWELVKNERI